MDRYYTIWADYRPQAATRTSRGRFIDGTHDLDMARALAELWMLELRCDIEIDSGGRPIEVFKYKREDHETNPPVTIVYPASNLF